MDITLVTSSFDKLVHGTENEKKTGCGINLLKPENVTRFHRTSQMTDLKEITCEKCKANLAKKLIKADKKEMALLLKEEKKREKLGMNDAGIVPLGNTTARITRDPDAKRKEEKARKKALEEQRKNVLPRLLPKKPRNRSFTISSLIRTERPFRAQAFLWTKALHSLQ